MLFRASLFLVLIGGAATALAGSGQLNVHAGAGLYDPLNVADYTEQSLSFSGIGTFGSISTSAAISGNGESATTFQSVSATITGETSGSVHFQEGWTTVGGSILKFDNVSPTATSTYPWATTYDFTTATDGQFDVVYDSTFSGTDPIGFGLWNTWVYVDGTLYQPTNSWQVPIPHGSWSIPLTAGAHSIWFQDTSNIAGGLADVSESLDETVQFAFSPVPEPSTAWPIAMGCLALGLLGRSHQIRARRTL